MYQARVELLPNAAQGQTGSTPNRVTALQRLDAKIAEEEKKLEEAEEFFKDEVQKLQDTYQKLSTEKDEKLAAVKAAGLGLMKSVKGAKAKETKDEL